MCLERVMPFGLKKFTSVVLPPLRLIRTFKKQPWEVPSLLTGHMLKVPRTCSEITEPTAFKSCPLSKPKTLRCLMTFTPKPNQTYALVFGNEVKGVSQEVVNLSDEVIEIPQYGTKHSLNISVSCGVVLWDLFSKLN